MKVLLTFFLLHSFTLVASETEIVQKLEKWPEYFNSKNLEKTCDLFAYDLIATYPGAPDRNYTEMCSHFRYIFGRIGIEYSYDKPKIEQVIVQDDLAIVRLTWTLTTISNHQVEQLQEKGIDVFKKQADGSWRIIISYAYTK